MPVFRDSNSTCVCPGFAPSDLRPYRHCLTTRGVVTTEDIDAELVSREPLLLVPEELSISTILAKEKLAPMLKAANLPSLEVTPSQLGMGNLLPDVLTSTCHAWPAFGSVRHQVSLQDDPFCRICYTFGERCDEHACFNAALSSRGIDTLFPYEIVFLALSQVCRMRGQFSKMLIVWS